MFWRMHMSRPKELLSLVSIADETGISYATLRNYALKHADEIPSEGYGRNTRYPRAAVKVFQRLRRESKPGRKPASASATQAPAAIQAPAPVRQEAPPQAQTPRPTAAAVAAVDISGIERELAAIRVFLGSIAESLERSANEPRSVAPAPVAAPVAVTPEQPEAPVPAAPVKTGVPLEISEGRESQEPRGHRRLHSLPKVMGQRGKRPE
jgi:hypothetical protein